MFKHVIAEGGSRSSAFSAPISDVGEAVKYQPPPKPKPKDEEMKQDPVSSGPRNHYLDQLIDEWFNMMYNQPDQGPVDSPMPPGEFSPRLAAADHSAGQPIVAIHGNQVVITLDKPPQVVTGEAQIHSVVKQNPDRYRQEGHDALYWLWYSLGMEHPSMDLELVDSPMPPSGGDTYA